MIYFIPRKSNSYSSNTNDTYFDFEKRKRTIKVINQNGKVIEDVDIKENVFTQKRVINHKTTFIIVCRNEILGVYNSVEKGVKAKQKMDIFAYDFKNNRVFQMPLDSEVE